MLTSPARIAPQPPIVADELGVVIWAPIAVFCALAAGAFLARGFRMDVGDASSFGLRLCAGIGASVVLMRRVDSRSIGIVLAAVMQTIIIANAAMMLTYAAATSGRPLVDAALLAFDRAIGYDWRVYGHWFAAGGLLRSAVLSTYDSIFVQPLILIVALVASGRVRRLETLILATTIALLITALMFALFPATTAWVYQGTAEGELGQYKHLPLASAGWIHDLLDIRQGGMRHVSPASGSGLTAFPSYHCIAALLNIWAVWPIKRLRPLFVLLNICTIAATPIVGGHYIADILGGGSVALVALFCAARLHRRLQCFRIDHRSRHAAGPAQVPQFCANI